MATSAYIAALQLNARSSQLATAEKVEERQGHGNGGLCQLGCSENEDEHLIFMNCPAFEERRDQAGKPLRKTLEEWVNKADIAKAHKNTILTKAKLFYSDDSELWPLNKLFFHLGHVPKLSSPLPQANAPHATRVILAVQVDSQNANQKLEMLNLYAKNAFHLNPENTAFDAKRLISCKIVDQDVARDLKRWPFKVAEKIKKPAIDVKRKGGDRDFVNYCS